MKGLLTVDNHMAFIAPRIERGFLDVNEPTVEKWAVYTDEGNLDYFVLDDDATLVDFDIELLPDNYTYGKYFFINGEFVLNPDWVEPPVPIEEQVSNLSESVEELAMVSAESEEALCDMDISYSQRLADIEEALCELAELLS